MKTKKTTAKKHGPKFPLQLSGRDGNAFFILGRFQEEARQAGWTPEQIKHVHDEATSGDYDHLLQTIMTYADVS